MAFHGGLTLDKLERARERCPDGYFRLANFVSAPSYTTSDVLRACQKHRYQQPLARVVKDRRAR